MYFETGTRIKGTFTLIDMSHENPSIYNVIEQRPWVVEGQGPETAFIYDIDRSYPDNQAGFRFFSSTQGHVPEGSYLVTSEGRLGSYGNAPLVEDFSYFNPPPVPQSGGYQVLSLPTARKQFTRSDGSLLGPLLDDQAIRLQTIFGVDDLYPFLPPGSAPVVPMRPDVAPQQADDGRPVPYRQPEVNQAPRRPRGAPMAAPGGGAPPPPGGGGGAVAVQPPNFPPVRPEAGQGHLPGMRPPAAEPVPPRPPPGPPPAPPGAGGVRAPVRVPPPPVYGPGQGPPVAGVHPPAPVAVPARPLVDGVEIPSARKPYSGYRRNRAQYGRPIKPPAQEMDVDIEEQKEGPSQTKATGHIRRPNKTSLLRPPAPVKDEYSLLPPIPESSAMDLDELELKEPPPQPVRPIAEVMDDMLEQPFSASLQLKPYNQELGYLIENRIRTARQSELAKRVLAESADGMLRFAARLNAMLGKDYPDRSPRQLAFHRELAKTAWEDYARLMTELQRMTDQSNSARYIELSRAIRRRALQLSDIYAQYPEPDEVYSATGTGGGGPPSPPSGGGGAVAATTTTTTPAEEDDSLLEPEKPEPILNMDVDLKEQPIFEGAKETLHAPIPEHSLENLEMDVSLPAFQFSPAELQQVADALRTAAGFNGDADREALLRLFHQMEQRYTDLLTQHMHASAERSATAEAVIEYQRQQYEHLRNMYQMEMDNLLTRRRFKEQDAAEGVVTQEALQQFIEATNNTLNRTSQTLNDIQEWNQRVVADLTARAQLGTASELSSTELGSSPPRYTSPARDMFTMMERAADEVADQLELVPPADMDAAQVEAAIQRGVAQEAAATLDESLLASEQSGAALNERQIDWVRENRFGQLLDFLSSFPQLPYTNSKTIIDAATQIGDALGDFVDVAGRYYSDEEFQFLLSVLPARLHPIFERIDEATGMDLRIPGENEKVTNSLTIAASRLIRKLGHKVEVGYMPSEIFYEFVRTIQWYLHAHNQQLLASGSDHASEPATTSVINATTRPATPISVIQSPASASGTERDLNILASPPPSTKGFVPAESTEALLSPTTGVERADVGAGGKRKLSKRGNPLAGEDLSTAEGYRTATSSNPEASGTQRQRIGSPELSLQSFRAEQARIDAEIRERTEQLADVFQPPSTLGLLRRMNSRLTGPTPAPATTLPALAGQFTGNSPALSASSSVAATVATRSPATDIAVPTAADVSAVPLARSDQPTGQPPGSNTFGQVGVLPGVAYTRTDTGTIRRQAERRQAREAFDPSATPEAVPAGRRTYGPLPGPAIRQVDPTGKTTMEEKEIPQSSPPERGYHRRTASMTDLLTYDAASEELTRAGTTAEQMRILRSLPSHVVNATNLPRPRLPVPTDVPLRATAEASEAERRKRKADKNRRRRERTKEKNK